MLNRVISIVLFSLYFSSSVLCNDELPCHFYDTVDLRNSQFHKNGSYIHDGIEIPANLVRLYDHIYETNQRIDVKPHLRGCICHVKDCIRWCCAPNQIYDSLLRLCIDFHEHISSEISLNTVENTSEEVVKDIKNYFYGFQSSVPCETVYALTPAIHDSDFWILNENGTVHVPAEEQLLSKQQYCFAINRDEDNNHTLTPFACSPVTPFRTREIIYGFTLIVSIPFMVITMIIYVAIPQLRKLHGKALICYLFSLAIAYSIMGHILLEGLAKLSVNKCFVIGFICYYFFMAAFFWLSVISFDLWWNFSGKKNHSQFSERQRFIGYSIYSWGLAGVFLIFAMAMQTSDNIDDIYKPGIGGNNYCFLDIETNWSATIYFYGPVLFIIIFNIIMFTLTALKIHKIQQEVANIMGAKGNERTLKNEKDRFGLFLRLFIVMGVTWIMEIITYSLGVESTNVVMIFLCDLCNSLQGLLIFILFILKKQVKVLILKKYKKTRDMNFSRQFSRTTSTTTGYSNPTSPTKLIHERKF